MIPTAHNQGAHYLWELDFAAIENHVVILDLDGTLLIYGEDTVASEAKTALEKIREKNEVFLFSNNVDSTRLTRLARELGVSQIFSPWRKPNPLIVRGVPKNKKSRVVIGDRTMTDGLFALFIGARFIKVRRAKSGNESKYVRMVYWLDDLWSSLAKSMKRRT